MISTPFDPKKISYVNSMDLNPPFLAPVLDSVVTNRREKMEVTIVNMVKCIHSLGKQNARKHNGEDDDNNDDSQLSLN